MEKSFDEELTDFLGEDQASRKAQQDISETAQRLRATLEESGVSFSPPDNVTAEGLTSLRDQNRALRSLATYIAAIRAMHVAKGLTEPADPDFKKKLQADLVYRGFDQAWLTAVDREVPGSPLTDDDTGLITSVAMEKILNDEANTARVLNNLSQMIDYLDSQGESQLSQKEHELLTHLCVQLEMLQTVGNPRKHVEDIKIFLIKSGYAEPAWMGLAEIFFSPPPKPD